MPGKGVHFKSLSPVNMIQQSSQLTRNVILRVASDEHPAAAHCDQLVLGANAPFLLHRCGPQGALRYSTVRSCCICKALVDELLRSSLADCASAAASHKHSMLLWKLCKGAVEVRLHHVMLLGTCFCRTSTGRVHVLGFRFDSTIGNLHINNLTDWIWWH